MNHLFKITVLLALLGLSLRVSATHNRSGEISYKRIPPFVQGGVPIYTYSITFVKYMNDDGGIQVSDHYVDTVYFADGGRGVVHV